MRALSVTIDPGDEGNLVMTSPEELRLACVIAVEGFGVYGMADGEPVKLEIAADAPWTAFLGLAGIVLRTPGSEDAVPCNYAIAHPRDHVGGPILQTSLEEHLAKCRTLLSSIPRKRPLR